MGIDEEMRTRVVRESSIIASLLSLTQSIKRCQSRVHIQIFQSKSSSFVCQKSHHFINSFTSNEIRWPPATYLPVPSHLARKHLG